MGCVGIPSRAAGRKAAGPGRVLVRKVTWGDGGQGAGSPGSALAPRPPSDQRTARGGVGAPPAAHDGSSSDGEGGSSSGDDGDGGGAEGDELSSTSKWRADLGPSEGLRGSPPRPPRFIYSSRFLATQRRQRMARRYTSALDGGASAEGRAAGEEVLSPHHHRGLASSAGGGRGPADDREPPRPPAPLRPLRPLSFVVCSVNGSDVDGSDVDGFNANGPSDGPDGLYQ